MRGTLLMVLAGLGAGCSAPPTPVAEGVGGAGGAALGAVIGHGSAVAAAGGALAGAALAAYSTEAERRAFQRGLDEGYALGTSDAVKRLYWAKQAAERPPGQGSDLSELKALLEEARRPAAPDEIPGP